MSNTPITPHKLTTSGKLVKGIGLLASILTILAFCGISYTELRLSVQGHNPVTENHAVQTAWTPETSRSPETRTIDERQPLPHPTQSSSLPKSTRSSSTSVKKGPLPRRSDSQPDLDSPQFSHLLPEKRPGSLAIGIGVVSDNITWNARRAGQLAHSMARLRDMSSSILPEAFHDLGLFFRVTDYDLSVLDDYQLAQHYDHLLLIREEGTEERSSHVRNGVGYRLTMNTYWIDLSQNPYVIREKTISATGVEPSKNDAKRVAAERSIQAILKQSPFDPYE